MPKHLPRRVSGQNIFNGVHAQPEGDELNWDRVWIVSGQMGLRRIPYGRPELSEVPPRLERCVA